VRIWTLRLEEFDNYIRGVDLPPRDRLSVIADIVDLLIVNWRETFVVGHAKRRVSKDAR